MKPPLQIRVPPKFCSFIVGRQGIPPGYAYPIKFAKPEFLDCKLGEFVIQSFNGGQYWLELTTIKMKQDGYIYIDIHSPFICIAAMLKGAIPSQKIGGEMLNLPAACYNIFYMPAGTFKTVLPTGQYTMFYIAPGAGYLGQMATEHPGLEKLTLLHKRKSKRGAMLESYLYPFQFRHILHQIISCKSKGAMLDLTLRQYVLEILGLYYQQLNKTGLNSRLSPNAEKARQILDYILNNIENLDMGGVKELAAAFYITPKTLTREFKKWFGLTVREFIKQERLNLAYKLIHEKGMMVFEAGILTGYSDTGNFSREFKKKFGVSPHEVHKPKD